jgi:hypothetical protein
MILAVDNLCRTILLAGSGAEGRWWAARQWFTDTGRLNPWVLTVLASLVALVTVAIAHFLIRQHREQKSALAFASASAKAGLNEAEQALLHGIARLSGLRRLEGVFTIGEAFERGVARLLQSDRVAQMSQRRREETAALLNRLREKLGYENTGTNFRANAVSVTMLPAGRDVSLLRWGGAEYVDGKVLSCSSNGRQVEIRPRTVADLEPGAGCQVRYSEDGLLWEVGGAIVKINDDVLTVALAPAAQCINRRRFARTATHKPAYVASFPFRTGTRGDGPPAFLPATLVEIAGPGMKLLSSLRLKVLEKLLIGVKFTDELALQGLAVVRRVDPDEQGQACLAVEMIGLNTSDVAELTRQTNMAIKAGEATEMQSDAVVAVGQEA